MQPIGPLMWEHRLIERMVSVLKAELARMTSSDSADPVAIDAAVDFFRTYADRTHHGKEEDILFRELRGMALSDEHRRIMDELVAEHATGRREVGGLVAAKERYVQGDVSALAGIRGHLGTLIEFYPRHIEKEDLHFFHPCMAYFTKAELKAMLDEMWEFDRKMLHERYGAMVREWETRIAL